MKSIVISGTGLFTPAESVTNEELVAAFNRYVKKFNQKQQQIEANEIFPLKNSDTEFIEKASGIKSRYVLNRSGILDMAMMRPQINSRSDEELSQQAEIAVIAAKQALLNANKKVSDIDAVLVACSNMQRAYPAMAIEVQAALGIDGFAYDLNVACSSATFGLQAAVNAITAGSAKSVLLVNPEICSAHLNFRDRDSHFIFGDAGTAAVVELHDTCGSKEAFVVKGCNLKTQFSNNIRNNFGFMNRIEIDNDPQQEKLFTQKGRKVFREIVPLVVDLVGQHLQSLNLTAHQLKRFWLHQANSNMNRLIASKLLNREPTADEAPIILDRYANTSSAGCMIAFHQYRQGLNSGDIGLLCSFGAGYSIGSIVLQKA